MAHSGPGSANAYARLESQPRPERRSMTDIAIKLPLPMSVSGSLMKLIGAAWPEAQLADNHGGMLSGDRHMVIRIPDAPAKELGEDDIALAVVAPGEDDVDLTELGPNDISLRRPKEVTAMMLHAILEGFRENPDAVNYLENEVLDPATGNRYVLTFARSKGQTPHELRMAAEARVDTVHANVHKEVTEQLMTLQARREDGTYADGVRAALDTVRQLNFSRIN
jgi:hypothetical protein